MVSHNNSILFATLIVCSISFEPLRGNEWEPGGDWIQYNDEKCFKIVDDTLRTFDEAKDACASQVQTSTLAVIRSSEEQKFLENHLFKTEQKVKNFWIGAKYSNGSFVWIDNSPLNYTNWASAFGLRNQTEQHCVHMQADEPVLGKWKVGSCRKKNAVLCQKIQFWSHELLQKAFLDSRKVQSDAIQNLTQSLANAYQRIGAQKHNIENVFQRMNQLAENFESANQRINEQKLNFDRKISEVSKELENSRQNPVPMGFVYVQLSGQPEPVTLWPTVQWQNVTSEYAGLFFRAEGGDSVEFGAVQEENAPRLTEIRVKGWIKSNNPEWNKTKLTVGGWSPEIGVYSGSWNRDSSNSTHYTHVFHQSGGEVRPQNMAIRVWKRIG